MSTRFVLRSIESCGLTFYLDGNGKITRGNGTFEHPSANAFSLVEIADCPGATRTCKVVCYVARPNTQVRDPIHAAWESNSRNIREIVGTDRQPLAVWTFADWIKRHASRGFRWHVSGDIYSLEYAGFIREVCEAAREVPFWLYTRSFELLRPLVGCKNLVVNLSADQDNYQAALGMHRRYGYRVCYLAVTHNEPPPLPPGSVIFPDHALRDGGKGSDWWGGLTYLQRPMVCPPDIFGQSELRRCGPCKKCLYQPYS